MTECDYCNNNDGVIIRRIIYFNIHRECIDDFDNEIEYLLTPRFTRRLNKIIYFIFNVIILLACICIIVYFSWGLTGMLLN